MHGRKTKRKGNPELCPYLQQIALMRYILLLNFIKIFPMVKELGSKDEECAISRGHNFWKTSTNQNIQINCASTFDTKCSREVSLKSNK